MDNEFYMRKAIEQARIALEKDEVPVGAVIVCNGQIIARAHNLTQTLNDVTAHAEMQAFTSATGFLGGKYLKDCTLFVTLEPCVMCAGAAYWTQIDSIVYGAKDEKRGFGTIEKNLLHPKTKVTGGVLENECSVLLKEFFAGKRK